MQVCVRVHPFDRGVRTVMHTAVIVVVVLAEVALYSNTLHHRLLIAFFDLVHHRFVFRSPPELEVSSDAWGAGALFFQLRLKLRVCHGYVAGRTAPGAISSPDPGM